MDSELSSPGPRTFQGITWTPLLQGGIKDFWCLAATECCTLGSGKKLICNENRTEILDFSLAMSGTKNETQPRMYSSRMRTARAVTVSGRGCVCQGSLPRGVMWPIQSCIWCYLYTVPTPTACQHQCSCLYSVAQVHAGIHTPLWTE